MGGCVPPLLPFPSPSRSRCRARPPPSRCCGKPFSRRPGSISGQVQPGKPCKPRLGGGELQRYESPISLENRPVVADSSDYENLAFHPHRGATALPVPSPKETQVLPADISRLHEEMKRLASLRLSKGDDAARGQSQEQQPSSSGTT